MPPFFGSRDVGVTRQYVLHLQKAFPQHETVVLRVAQQSKELAEDSTVFDKVIAEVRSSHGVIWAFLLYILLVSSQYRKFIELVAERGAHAAFEGNGNPLTRTRSAK